MPCLYNIDDLDIMAQAWVNKNTECSPGSEEYQLWVERIKHDLAEQLMAAGHPVISA